MSRMNWSGIGTNLFETKKREEREKSDKEKKAEMKTFVDNHLSNLPSEPSSQDIDFVYRCAYNEINKGGPQSNDIIKLSGMVLKLKNAIELERKLHWIVRVPLIKRTLLEYARVLMAVKFHKIFDQYIESLKKSKEEFNWLAFLDKIPHPDTKTENMIKLIKSNKYSELSVCVHRLDSKEDVDGALECAVDGDEWQDMKNAIFDSIVEIETEATWLSNQGYTRKLKS